MSLLAEIQAFTSSTDMPDTTFGRLAVGDPRFVSDLRNGRSPRESVLTRCRAFMTAQASTRKPAASSAANRDAGRFMSSQLHSIGELATLPDVPCIRCGARGWCDHRRPDPNS